MDNERYFRHQLNEDTIDRTLIYYALFEDNDIEDSVFDRNANIRICKCMYDQLSDTTRHLKFLRYYGGNIVPLFEDQCKDGWVEVLQDVPIKTREYPEELLPAEGIDIFMKDTKGNIIEGYFVWSGEYVFLARMEDDDTMELDNIIAWQYKKKNK